MENIGQQILIIDAKRLETIEQKIDTILTQLAHQPEDHAIPFPLFCRQRKISRVTGYAWRDRGLIVMERRGGRQFVVEDNSAKRYQRTIAKQF